MIGKPGVSITCINCQPYRSNTKLVLYGNVSYGGDLSRATYRWTELTGEGEFDIKYSLFKFIFPSPLLHFLSRDNINNLPYSSPSVLSSPTSKNLVVAPYSLKHRLAYNFQLEVTTPTGTGYAIHSVTPGPPPLGGSFNVVPPRGVALSTQFSLQCNGWSSYDGSALKYSFAYQLKKYIIPKLSFIFCKICNQWFEDAHRRLVFIFCCYYHTSIPQYCIQPHLSSCSDRGYQWWCVRNNNRSDCRERKYRQYISNTEGCVKLQCIYSR